MLKPEWDPYNCNTEKEPEQQMREGDPYSTYQNPDYVHDRRQATRTTVRHNRRPSKREERQRTELEDLKPEWNANDRQAHEKSAHKILQSDKYAAKEEPYDITYYTHSYQDLRYDKCIQKSLKNQRQIKSMAIISYLCYKIQSLSYAKITTIG